MSQQKKGTGRDIARMEGFSDGVFATAITLPIFSVEMPDLGADGGDLLRALASDWPSYAAYLLSFFVIGVYWLRHHFAGKIYVQADHGFNLVNLMFLMTVCFVPFPIRVLLEYLGDPTRRDVASIFFLAALLLPAITWTIKWFYAARTGTIDHRLDPAYVRGLTRRYVATVAAYAAALLLVFLDHRLGLLLGLAVTLLYLWPPPPPVFASSTEDRDAS